MRTPLSRLLAGLLLLSGPAVPVQAEVVGAVAPDVYGVEIPRGQVLPPIVGDRGAPAVATQAGTQRGPAAESVQAIPTPTAFHAGLGVLAVTIVFRRLRRRNTRHV